ncbi:caveolae-associated protein 3-like [Vanessa cardui]|uniref:caveolae-associated protein 3-like n=1 Tax=Vanessa cardui TaxID=171605 RepID=UPI001F139A6D|nr:caveolae-associated protein 3-like [Vanessa cardui]
MQARPPDELGACIFNSLTAIEKVADRSRKMKGSLVCELREATRNLAAAVTELLRRHSECADVESAVAKSKGTAPTATTVAAPAALGPVASRKRNPAAQAGRAHTGATATQRASVAPRAPASLVSRPALAGRTAPIRPLEAPSPEPPPSEKRKNRGRKRRAGPAPPPVTVLPPVLAPSPPSSRPMASAANWATVAARKAQPGSRLKAPSQPVAKKAPKRGLPKVPTTAAVAITVVEGATMTYTEVMCAARTHTQLRDLGIETVEFKKAITGGVLLKLSDPDSGEKADCLAAQMREVLRNLARGSPNKNGRVTGARLGRRCT